MEAVVDTTPIVANPSMVRSRVTNGRKLVAGLDGRSAEARRYKDLCLSLAGDLGGTSVMGAGQTALVRQAAAMIVQSEKLHGAVLRGEVIDTEQLTRLANAATRIIGALKRGRPTPRSETPSLSAYMASRPASPLPSATALPRTQESRPEAPEGRAHED